ncbi:hypothetical protein [Streptomyces qinglanensis]|uniref:Uncharacterized protein n=1 Tax=Streptomyces qinglanensis TaxID=943816 RepID=A0A1H9WXE4_9ACTN|nr:hypothetical protein [Streptomyces qinglanensis]SES38357.1 hypothetical protein SAMN05421870_12319 [Streptomyces qinglanensis]
MTEEPQFAPWGVVSAGFWAGGTSAPPTTAGRPDGQASAHPMLAPAAAHESAEPQQPPPPPEEYRERVAAITSTFAPPHDTQRLAWAAIQAERLDQEATATYGAAHTHTISVRELRGWIARLQGDPEAATHWDLHVIQLQVATWGTHHTITRASAQRAVRHWTEISDPATRVALSKQLLGMLVAVSGENSGLSRHVRKLVRRAQSPAAR